MAAEMVVGAVVSSSVEFLREKIGSFDVVSYLRGKDSGFDGLLEKLETTFLCLDAVLADAEQKQIRNPGVEKWLDKLQDAVDDAEDLFGEIEYDALKLKVEAELGISTSKVTNFFNFFNSTDRDRKTKMEEILGRLENFAKQINILGLDKSVGEKIWQSLPSTSLLEFEVYGRDHDKDAVIKLLMYDDMSRQEICVIPIVGMGGIGKTTLAQAVFNNEKVEKHFKFKAWVCVSDEFDVFRVTKTILGEAETSNITDLNLLQEKLKEKLTGKKFLIVLDDVWNENYITWNNLKKPFKYGAQGSKIIVTTRSGDVASIMGTVPTHHLKQLTDEECWKIFAKHASNGIDGDFTTNSDLKSIGREIVKKCKGLPLAATTLGGLLRSTLDAGKWERIAKSEFWELTNDQSNILPALRLSYHYLPSNLKRCFAYCSIFPKDYEFEKEELVLLWMAENILEHPKRNMKMEEVGYEYFNDLVSRSFFQRSSTNRSHFVMHDLMVDLAKFVSRKKYLLIEEGKSYEIGLMKQARHIAYDKECPDPQEVLKSISEATCLRTFLPLQLHGNDLSFTNILVDDLLKLRCLRSLSLKGYQNVKHLPESIRELRHLCYLDLSYTSISELPTSLSMLYNLQTLKLYHCFYLTKLPKNFHCLINLRYLDVNHSGLVEMPTQISKLKNLQKLSAFIVGKSSGAKIGELGELSDLGGRLSIWDLQNVMKAKDDAWAAKLRDKKHLEELELKWCVKPNVAEHERDVLDNLLPNTKIRELNITNYGGQTFPKWLGDQSFYNLVDLSLLNCMFCHTLPPLGQLPSLKNLSMVKFDAIEMVGLDFYGTSSSMMKPFAALESLKFYYWSNWKEWSIPSENIVAFPKLRKLEVTKCVRLTGDLSCLLPSLIELSLSFCSELASSLQIMPSVNTVTLNYCYKLVGFQVVESFSCLQNLNIFYCPNLEFPLHRTYKSLQELCIHSSCSFIRLLPLDSFPNIRNLRIEACENLESFSQFKGLNSLSSLDIVGCPNFTFFPNSYLRCPILTRLELRYCKKLKFLPSQLHWFLPSLQHLQINDCPELESLPRFGLPFSLRELEIFNCDKVIATRKNWNLQALPYLTSFIVGNYGCEDMKSFPEQGLLPTSITHLKIYLLDCLVKPWMRGGFKNSPLWKIYTSVAALTCRHFRKKDCQPLLNLLASLNVLCWKKSARRRKESTGTRLLAPHLFSSIVNKSNDFLIRHANSTITCIQLISVRFELSKMAFCEL